MDQNLATSYFLQKILFYIIQSIIDSIMHKNDILPFLAIFDHFQAPEIGQKWKMKQIPRNYLILIYSDPELV